MSWTKKEIEEHIKVNLGTGDDYSYSSAVVIAALFKKLYADWPRIGLSGFQAEAVESLVDNLPNELYATADPLDKA